MARSFCGPRLRDERRLAGYTAAQLAARIGRTPSTILKYETGAAQPPVVIADALADALGVRLDGLLADGGGA